MREGYDDILALTPGVMICDDQMWPFPGPGSHPGGVGRLRVFTSDEGPLLAVVSECGIGRSVMNAAEQIVLTVRERYAPQQVVVLEHWPVEQRGVETLDHVVLRDDGPVRCRVDPVEPVDPWRRQWMRQHARRMLDSGGPWALPAALVQQALVAPGRRSEHHQNT